METEKSVVEYLYIGCEEYPMEDTHTCFNAATVDGSGVGRESAEGLFGQLTECVACGGDIMEMFEKLSLPPRQQISVSDVMEVFEKTNGFVTIAFTQVSELDEEYRTNPEIYFRRTDTGLDVLIADGFPHELDDEGRPTENDLRRCLNRYPYEFRTIDDTPFNDSGRIESKLLKPN